VVSGIWHGFYSGYQIFFLSAGLFDYSYKLGENIVVPFVKWTGVPSRLAIAVLWVHCYANCAYFGMSFLLASSERTRVLYGGMNYILHKLLAAQILILLILKFLIRPAKKETKMA
jgi:hypothetical protein